jgi:hypothetical protein
MIIHGVLIGIPPRRVRGATHGIATHLASRARSRDGAPRAAGPAGAARAQLVSYEAHGQDPLWRHLTTTCSCQRGGGEFRSVRLNNQVHAAAAAAALQLKSIR